MGSKDAGSHVVVESQPSPVEEMTPLLEYLDYSRTPLEDPDFCERAVGACCSCFCHMFADMIFEAFCEWCRSVTCDHLCACLN